DQLSTDRDEGFDARARGPAHRVTPDPTTRARSRSTGARARRVGPLLSRDRAGRSDAFTHDACRRCAAIRAPQVKALGLVSRRLTLELVGIKRLDLHGNVVARSAPHISTCSSSRDEAQTGRPAAMDTISIDLHKRESQLCIGHDDGTVEERRIATTRERFTAALGERPRARILLEASTESEWVARHLESLGHDVIVADPNFAPMYATRSRRT